MLTFGEVKNSAVVNISGCCARDAKFRQMVNDAVRRLMRRGDWSGVVTPIQVCVTGESCVVFPRFVDKVRKVNRCNTPIAVRNMWYHFLDTGQYMSCCVAPNSPLGLSAFGRIPTHSSVYGDGRYIRAYPQESVDVGKTITIYGVDNNDQPLKEYDSDTDSWSMGLELTLTMPYVSTSVYVRRIDRVVREETQTRTFLFGYDPVLDALEDLAVYEPTETVPDYQRYQLRMSCCSSTDCSTSKSIVALVKVKPIPAKYDNDPVWIDNLDALKLMVQCIKAEEAGDRVAARAYEMDAIRETNLQLWDDNPEPQIAVSDEVFNGVPLGRQQCF